MNSKGKSLREIRERFVPVADVLPECGLAIKRWPSLSLEQLVFSGAIPIVLLESIGFNPQENAQFDFDWMQLLKSGQLGEMNDLANSVFKAALVEPEVGDEPGEDVIGVNEPWLSFNDKMYIFEAVTEGVKQVAPFSEEEQGSGGDAASPGGGV